MALEFDSSAEMATAFEALAVKGNVQAKIERGPEGDFGMLADMYGIRWMFIYNKKPG